MAQDTKHWFKTETSWNYRRKTSEWHFDPTRIDDAGKDPGIRMNFVQFKGDWKDEILAKPFDERAPLDLSEWLQKICVQEHIELGISPYIEGKRVTVDKEQHPKISKIVDSLGIKDPYAQILRQMPGEMFTYHIDQIVCGAEGRHGITSMDNVLRDDESVRVFIALEDWNWGTHLLMGNYHWKQWSAGDIMWFRWQDMPHGSANCGHKPRYFLKVTGKKTDTFEKLLQGQNQIINV